MRCDEAFEALSAACDGALAVDEATSLEHHLARCEGCQARATELRTLNRRLRGSGREQAGPPPRLESRIRALLTPPPPAARRWPFTFGFAVVGATGALAALSIVANAAPQRAGRALGGEMAAAAGSNGESSRPCRNGERRERRGPARSPITRACAEGGFAAARLAMQQMVDRANAKGAGKLGKITCGTCHRDQIRFDLRDDARVRLNDLLALAPT
ncbi:MAG TPA: anti-sigma factor [Polyangia bacterium]